ELAVPLRHTQRLRLLEHGLGHQRAVRIARRRAPWQRAYRAREPPLDRAGRVARRDATRARRSSIRIGAPPAFPLRAPNGFTRDSPRIRGNTKSFFSVLHRNPTQRSARTES